MTLSFAKSLRRHHKDFFPLDVSTSALDGRLIRRPAKDAPRKCVRALSGFKKESFVFRTIAVESTLPPKAQSWESGAYCRAVFVWGGTAEVDSNNQFTVRDVPEGEFHLTVAGASKDCYVKEARFGDALLPDMSFRVVKGSAGPLEITVSCLGARVEGTVTNEESLPVAAVVAPGQSGSGVQAGTRTGYAREWVLPESAVSEWGRRPDGKPSAYASRRAVLQCRLPARSSKSPNRAKSASKTPLFMRK